MALCIPILCIVFVSKSVKSCAIFLQLSNNYNFDLTASLIQQANVTPMSNCTSVFVCTHNTTAHVQKRCILGYYVFCIFSPWRCMRTHGRHRCDVIFSLRRQTDCRRRLTRRRRRRVTSLISVYRGLLYRVTSLTATPRRRTTTSL